MKAPRMTRRSLPKKCRRQETSRAGASLTSRALLPQRFSAGGEGADRRMRGPCLPRPRRHPRLVAASPLYPAFPTLSLKSSAPCYPSRAFSPAVSWGGEGADRRMRGRFTRTSFARESSFQAGLGQRRKIVHVTYTPPHPPSAPSPPAEKRWGRRLSTSNRVPDDSRESVRNAGCARRGTAR